MNNSNQRYQNYRNKPLLRISKPHGRQTYFTNKIPVEAWAVCGSELHITDPDFFNGFSEKSLKVFFQIFKNEQESPSSDILLFGPAGSEIYPLNFESSSEGVRCSDFEFVLDETCYKTPSGTNYGRILHVKFLLSLPDNFPRNIFINLSLQFFFKGLMATSNSTYCYLDYPDAYGDSLRAGLEKELPPVLFYPVVILPAWTFQRNSQVSTVSIEVRDGLGESPEFYSETEIGLKGSVCEETLPDLEDAHACGTESVVDFSKGVSSIKNNDFAFFQKSSSDLSSLHEQLFGFTKLIVDVPPFFLTNVVYDNLGLSIEGLLLCNAYPAEKFLIEFSSYEEKMVLTEELSFCCHEHDLLTIGACTDRCNPRLKIILGKHKIPLFFNSFALFVESQGQLHKLTTEKDERAIRELATLVHRESKDVRSISVKSKEALKWIKRSFDAKPKSASDMPLSENITTLNLSNVKESKFGGDVIFYFHNLEAAEGAPLVFKNILDSFSEIFKDSEKTYVTAFRDGPLRGIFEKNNYEVNIIESASMVFQTEERYFEALSSIRSEIRIKNPRFIIANCLDSFVAVDAAVREGIPVVWMIHESVKPWSWYRSYNYRIRMHCLHALRNANKIIFVSEQTRQMYLPFIEEHKSIVIPNAIDAEEHLRSLSNTDALEVKKTLNITSKSLVLLSVGTTTERKGQDRTLRELALLKQKRPDLDFVFLMVGAREIPFLKHLRQLTTELGLEKEVRFIYETNEVKKYYAIADICIINSREESFPLVTLEAFSSKIPLVSTEVFGLKEIIVDEENALAFNGDAHGELSDALLRIIDSVTLREKLVDSAFKLMKSRYGLEEWKRKLADVFSSV